jgi:signal transduction histidine kinase
MAAVLAGTAGIYYLAAKLASLVTPNYVIGSPIWPPTGLALGGMLLLGYRIWPGIFVGSCFAAVSSLGQVHAPIIGLVVAALSVAIGSTLETLVGTWLARRWARGRDAFRRPSTILLFVGVTAVLSTLLSPSIGVPICGLAGYLKWDTAQRVWFSWWLGDMVSAIVLTPLFLVWATRRLPLISLKRVLEGAIALVLLVLTCELVFGSSLTKQRGGAPLTFLLIPFLLWTALRFGQRGTTTFAFILACVATGGTLRGLGPFALSNQHYSLLLLQNFIAVVTVMSLILAANVAQQQKVEARLRLSEQRLNADLAERTRNELALRESNEQLRLALAAQKEAESEVVRLNVELERRVHERTMQLEAINKELEAFSYSVSHDLRAPLRSIRGFSEVLLQRYADKLDKRGKEFLRRAAESSQHMDMLIDDLLKLSRVGRSELQHQLVDLSSLSATIASDLQQSEPKREANFIIAGDLKVRGDERLLRIVLENLLRNAWKFTARKEQARIEFGFTREPEPAFFVRDNGAGFDMAYAARLFGVFQRLHSASEFPGTGVGLATVQRIINRHGGRAWAEGAIEHGATFYFSLPQNGVV